MANRANIFSTYMKKDSAQWICNSLYSVMVSIFIASLFTHSPSNDMWSAPWKESLPVYLIIAILFVYFISDWLSYNAIMDIDECQSHFEVLAYIVSIISLGALLFLSIRLVNNQGAGTAYLRIFEVFLLVYVIATTVIGYKVMFNEIRNKAKEIISETEESRLSWQFIDYTLRVLSAAVLAVFVSIRSFSAVSEDLIGFLWAYAACMLLLTVGKCFRYDRLLLPIVQEAVQKAVQEAAGTRTER